MVITPGIKDLPYTYDEGIKYFTLIAEEIVWELVDGIFVKAWGYNGSTPGPTIRVFPGDRVCIRVINHLPERTSVHWHGLEVPNIMDGVPPIEPSPYIEPGEYFDYTFTINNPPGTYMYHSHVNVSIQDNAGLLGGLIVEDPRMQNRKKYKDYLCLLQEWAIGALPWGDLTKGTYDLTFVKPEFNFFTINGKCYPDTKPLPVEYGDTVRVRFGNIQMHHHPMHLHGHQFRVVGADGFPIARDTQIYKNTILVASGETWDIRFLANNEGIWPFHCHMPHHVTNNGTPPVGGMFTTVNYQS
ncbi:MAG: multicopper oxidase domain-containing protein [Zhenhengia sp.]|uniref:multicopper oxidase domain-containing protein n=1 Tax=Zhenhengia sp. TaxID=2944208 RepID=UPI0015AA9846|nr:copper oxidase [Niameybacter sp.]MBS5800704.1 copper oxidase [Clostridiales bacterium]